MALIPRTPHFPLPSLEEKSWKAKVGDFALDLSDYLRRLIKEINKSYEDIYKAFLQSWYVKYDITNVSNPPTDAQLDSIFGSPGIVGPGFTAVINDNGAGSNEYFIWSDGTYWWYTTGTKAT